MLSRASLFWLWKREFSCLLERKWDFALLTWIPLAIIILSPLIYVGDLPQNIPIVIVDADHSAMSRKVISLVNSSSRIKQVAILPQLEDGKSAVRKGEANAVLYLPAGSQKKAKRGEQADIFLFYNNAYYTEGNLLAKDVGGIISALNASMKSPRSTGNFVVNSSVPLSPAPLAAQVTTLFNPGGSYQRSIATILYPALLHIVMAAVFVVSFFRDYCTPHRYGWLKDSSPKYFIKAYLVKILFFSLWFSALSLLSIVYISYFGWSFNGNFFAVLLGLFLMYFAYAALMTIITIALKEKLNTALSISSVITSPALAYGNALFPVTGASWLVKAYSACLPFSYYASIQLHSWTGAASFLDNAHKLITLSSFCLVFLVVALWMGCRSLSKPVFENTEAE